MLRIVLVLVVISCALAAPPGDFILPPQYNGEPEVPMLDGRIVGGSVASIANHPYSLSLRAWASHMCGASIISATWTLTAAHCVSGMSVASLSFRAGSALHASGGITRQVNGGFIHGSYNTATLNFDVAVLSVSVTFPIGQQSISTIGLPGQGTRPAAGVSSIVSGWGHMSEGGSISPQLRFATVPIVSLAACRASYGTSAITDNMLCAGFTGGGVDACQGDSGGPLRIANIQVGIVSWGNGCARPNFPGVYVNVGSVSSWIASAAS